MFVDSFAVNLVIFLAGQIVAYLYLRTGRRQRGLALLIGAWILIDVVLVERFAFQRTGALFVTSLILVQVWSLGELAGFLYSRIRRRLASVRERRDGEFRRGLTAYLRNELGDAVEAFRGIVQRDPWDLPSVLALATAMARMEDPRMQRRARSWFRVARDLDVDAQYAEIIAVELGVSGGAEGDGSAAATEAA